MAEVRRRWQVDARWGWEPVTLLGLLVFVGVGAVYGGVGLMRDGMGMPLEWLHRLPVDTWLWPGVALLVTVAVPQVVAAWMVWRRDPRAGAVGVVVGAALVVWIVVQVALLQRYYFLQPVIAGIGLAEVGISLAWTRRAQRSLTGPSEATRSRDLAG